MRPLRDQVSAALVIRFVRSGAGRPPEREAALPGGSGSLSPSDRGVETPRRTVLVPVLVALVVSLIGGVFGFAAVGFNSLRADMNEGFARVQARFAHIETRLDARFAQIDARFAQVDARFAQVDARFAQVESRLDAVNQTLLDHTDRLTRIETLYAVHPHPAGDPQTTPLTQTF